MGCLLFLCLKERKMEGLRLGVPDISAIPPGSVVHALWDIYYVRREGGLWIVQAKREGNGLRVVRARNLSELEDKDGENL